MCDAGHDKHQGEREPQCGRPGRCRAQEPDNRSKPKRDPRDQQHDQRKHIPILADRSRTAVLWTRGVS